MKRLIPAQTLIVVVDVQERLAAAMPPAQMTELTRGTTILLEAARLLGAPVIATEQYKKGLGPTVPAVDEKLTALGAPRIEKTDFSACDVPAFRERLEAIAPGAAVVVGMETHVCVFQTVRQLVARGLEVYVPIDAVASRREDHRVTGLSLCERAGAAATTTETVVFDWLARAGSEEFKALSKLIR